MVLATWRQSVRSQELLTVSSPVSWKLNNKFSCSVGGRTTKANAFTHSEGRKQEIERWMDSGKSEGGENNSNRQKGGRKSGKRQKDDDEGKKQTKMRADRSGRDRQTNQLERLNLTP